MTPFQFQVERLDMKTIAPKLKITAIQRCSRAKLDTIRSEFELLVAKQEKRLRNFIVKHFRENLK